MNQFHPFSGVITALITPFCGESASLDIPSLHRLIKIQKNAGIRGIVVLGTTGESPSLTEAEGEEIVRAALSHQTADFHVYVGTGGNNTQMTIEKTVKFARLRSETGASPDGVMIVTPWYNRPSQKGLEAHFSEVAHAIADIPVCLYNVPGRTGVTLLPQTAARIAANNPNVVAIKEAAGNVSIMSELRLILTENGRKDVRILSGDDATFAPALLCGADGVISVTTHLIPRTMVRLHKAFYEGDSATVRQLHLASYCLNAGLFTAASNPVGIKWLLSHAGLCQNVLRLPLIPAEKDAIEKLLFIIKQMESHGIDLHKEMEIS